MERKALTLEQFGKLVTGTAENIAWDVAALNEKQQARPLYEPKEMIPSLITIVARLVARKHTILPPRPNSPPHSRAPVLPSPPIERTT
jgi:hypothetical protein